jgi:antirestriction protein ArdC
MHLAGDRAFYTPGLDRINVPELALFVEKVGTDAAQDHFYATALHEVTHWTGAEHRLSREGITKFGGFGSKSYAFEELVAELGAAMLCQFTGIVQGEQLDENHAAYLKSWCEALKDDPRAMERATKLAIESATWTLTQAGMMDGAKDEEPAPEPTPEPKAKPTPKPKAKPKAPRKTRKPKAKPEPAPVVVAPIPEPGGQFTLF